MNTFRIAIVGAGTMGTNIALDFAAHGHTVRLTDSISQQLDNSRELAHANATQLEKHGLLREPAAGVVRRITYDTHLEWAVTDSDLIIEAVPEDLVLKRRTFAELEGLCNAEAIFASNTSSFMPSMLCVGLKHPDRLLVTHYWNPAHLLPLVEVVRHEQTTPAVVQCVCALLKACGKKPIVLKRELPGFIGNRLAFALQREAMELAAREVATPEDIDAVVRNSFGRRIVISGIFGTADLGGLDVYAAICDSIFPDLCSRTEAPAALTDLVKRGRHGVKTGAGWRSYTAAEIATLREAVSEELIRQAQKDREAPSTEPKD